MSLNLVRLASGNPGSAATHAVASGTTSSITDGTMVAFTPNSQYVSLIAGSFAVGTNFLLGIAQGSSTETASVAGTVAVNEISSFDEIYIPADSSLGTYGALTQAQYNALVGKFVNFSTTSGIVTCLGTHNANNPFIVRPYNVSENNTVIKVLVRTSALGNF